MLIKDIISQTIAEKFSPEKLEIVDESYKHAGHAGANPLGESHFLIRVSAASFAQMSRIERERLIRRAIDGAVPRPIHAVRFEFI